MRNIIVNCRPGISFFKGILFNAYDDNDAQCLGGLGMVMKTPGGDYVGAGKGIVENNDGPTTPQTYFNPSQYVNFIPKLFKKAREILGDEVELLHDVHERVSCSDAIRLAKSLEPYHLFFLEDIFKFFTLRIVFLLNSLASFTLIKPCLLVVPSREYQSSSVGNEFFSRNSLHSDINISLIG